MVTITVARSQTMSLNRPPTMSGKRTNIPAPGILQSNNMNCNDNGDLLEEARVKHDREMTSGCCRGGPLHEADGRRDRQRIRREKKKKEVHREMRIAYQDRWQWSFCNHQTSIHLCAGLYVDSWRYSPLVPMLLRDQLAVGLGLMVFSFSWLTEYCSLINVARTATYGTRRIKLVIPNSNGKLNNVSVSIWNIFLSKYEPNELEKVNLSIL